MIYILKIKENIGKMNKKMDYFSRQLVSIKRI